MSEYNPVEVFLTRRNLLTLLNKLDYKKEGGETQRTITKRDTVHPEYPITGASEVRITALEDKEYYTDREPGRVLEYPVKREESEDRPRWSQYGGDGVNED